MNKLYRVLIVDDEEEICQTLADAFGKKFSITTATRADSALIEIGKISPDLIITDINMPEKTGIQFLQQLRDQGDERHVVLMTGHGGLQNLASALKLRAFDILEKPFKLATIESVILKSQKISQSFNSQYLKISDLNLSQSESAGLKRSAEQAGLTITQYISESIKRDLKTIV